MKKTKKMHATAIIVAIIATMMMAISAWGKTRLKFGGPGTASLPPTEETVEEDYPPTDMGAVNGPQGTEWFPNGGSYFDKSAPDAFRSSEEEYRDARYAATGELVDPSTIPSISLGGDPTPQRKEANRQINLQTGK